MRYQIRKAGNIDVFKLVDLKDNHRVAYRGPFQWTCAMSLLLNFEDMRLHGETGGSVPQIDKFWPRDGRFADRPMPPEIKPRLIERSVPSVRSH